jgi:hypothetical protein
LHDFVKSACYVALSVPPVAIPSPEYRPCANTSDNSTRCLAFAGVFFFHADDQAFPYGAMGVPLFFVLSGFFITRLLVLNEGPSLGATLSAFYARRTLRIFPLSYAVLCVLLLAGKLPDAGRYFAYLHKVYVFQEHAWTGNTQHFWSLCVAEQFYALLPVAGEYLAWGVPRGPLRGRHVQARSASEGNSIPRSRFGLGKNRGCVREYTPPQPRGVFSRAPFLQ